MSMSEHANNALFESSLLLEEARRHLVESMDDDKEAYMLVPKAVSALVDVLAILQDEILDETRIVGLDFPTKLDNRFERLRNG